MTDVYIWGTKNLAIPASTTVDIRNATYWASPLPASWPSKPFNELIVLNASAQSIDLVLDADPFKVWTIPANGGSLEIDKEDKIFFLFFQITNLSNAISIAASTITATLRRV